MKFHEVSKAMNGGKKIKLKDWDNAYWYKKGGIIINHDEEGFECDAREIFPFDLMWVANGDWEIVVENLTPMNFKEAFKLMKQGYPVKLPSWGGYWYWDAAKETIVMHTKDGKELDIRETKRVEYTTLNILSDEWVLASTKNCPAMGGEATFSFGEAIKYLKRGHKVARKGWNGKKQYIQLASGISYKAPTGDIVNCEHDAIGNMAVAFVGTSGVQMGWLASQADMLADDWVFAEQGGLAMFYLLGVIIGLVISFLITALLIWILAMCFGFLFTWKLALGVWVIYLIIKSIFTRN